MWLAEIQRWVPLIVGRAKKDRSPESTAYFILDELSEDTQQKLAEFAVDGLPDDATEELALSHFLQRLMPLLPGDLQVRPEWVREFLATLLTGLLGDEGDEPSEPEPGAPAGPLDLAAEAERRMALLDDKPVAAADDDGKTGEDEPEF